MPAAAIGGLALGVGGSLMQSDAAKSAANAQKQASEAAIAEQRREFDLVQNYLAPYRNIGTQALGTLGGIYGYNIGGQSGQQPLGFQDWVKQNPGQANNLGGGYGWLSGLGNYTGYQDYLKNFKAPVASPGFGTPGTPDYTSFFASPDYAFRRSEGQRGIEQSSAARGGAFSGNALKALNQYNSNLAAGEFGNWWNRQAGLAGVGQNAVNNTAQFGQNATNAIGNAMIGAGDARASGIVGSANAWGNLLGGLGGMLFKGF